MRLLLDECCAPALARALRGAGHDVRHVLEQDQGADDEAIADLAAREGRVLITEDKGFGEVAVARGRSLPGVILLRIEPRHRNLKSVRLLSLLQHHGDRLLGSFVVVEVADTRLRPLRATECAASKRDLRQETLIDAWSHRVVWRMVSRAPPPSFDELGPRLGRPRYGAGRGWHGRLAFREIDRRGRM